MEKAWEFEKDPAVDLLDLLVSVQVMECSSSHPYAFVFLHLHKNLSDLASHQQSVAVDLEYPVTALI
jgi:hypothetical protein